MVSEGDTIFAVASGRGRAGIAVVRVSGPAAGLVLRQLGGCGLPPARRATLVRLRDGEGETIDRGLVLWFPAPASVTGEDVAEFHVHGGTAVSAAVLKALGSTGGLRAAEPGEFTRRALLHGKLDLTQAEAVADVVAAETEAQRRQALRQLEGDLSQVYEDWRQRVLRLMAHLEAAIDFADEDVPVGLEEEVRRDAAVLADALDGHLADGGRGERVREGLYVAIVGAPNAGKSSLLNALARREAAIVSSEPGTTRDIIDVALDIGGYPVVLSDTAGIRGGGEGIEIEGIRRARAAAAQADLKLVVIDGARWPLIDEETKALIDDDSIVVLSKADLSEAAGKVRSVGGCRAEVTSTVTGQGLAELAARIGAEIEKRWGLREVPALTRTRHRLGVVACRDALRRVGEAVAVETAAEELRSAAAALGRVTGRIDVEEMLGAVFRDFCIGK